MYLGKIVELADKKSLFANPAHPYTRALLSAVPIADPDRVRNRIMLSGDIPSPIHVPPGCSFSSRCPMAQERCRKEVPELREIRPGHFCRCLLAQPDNADALSE